MEKGFWINAFLILGIVLAVFFAGYSSASIMGYGIFDKIFKNVALNPVCGNDKCENGEKKSCPSDCADITNIKNPFSRIFSLINSKNIEKNRFASSSMLLNCNNTANREFCGMYKRSLRNTGYGTYNLSNNDMVVILPFILKWERHSWGGIMKVFWINEYGNPLLLSSFYYSEFIPPLFMGMRIYDPIYIFTDVDSVLDGDPTEFIITNDNARADEWYGLHDLISYRTTDFIGVAPRTYMDYNVLITKSFQNCYNEVSAFLEIGAPLRPVYITLVESEGNSGCSAGSSVGCILNHEVADLVLNRTWNVNGIDYPTLINDGYCLGFSAQAHELVHNFLYGTHLQGAGALNEGLAVHVQHKVALDDRQLTCLDNGFILEGDMERPYTNLTNFASGNDDYQTGACFWNFIEETYGHEKLVEIIRAFDDVRYNRGPYYFFSDFLIPALGPEVLPLAQERFGLVEYTLIYQ